MNERRPFIPEKVSPIGQIERAGQIVQRDLKIIYGGKTFVLSVGTQNYIDLLTEYNKSFPEEQKLDEKVLPIENVNEVEEVITKLSSFEPQEILPYLAEQEE